MNNELKKFDFAFFGIVEITTATSAAAAAKAGWLVRIDKSTKTIPYVGSFFVFFDDMLLRPFSTADGTYTATLPIERAGFIRDEITEFVFEQGVAESITIPESLIESVPAAELKKFLQESEVLPGITATGQFNFALSRAIEKERGIVNLKADVAGKIIAVTGGNLKEVLLSTHPTGQLYHFLWGKAMAPQTDKKPKSEAPKVPKADFSKFLKKA